MGIFQFYPPEGGPRKPKPVSNPTQFSDINITSEREDGELYCDYKCRQWWVNRIMRRYAKGRVISGGAMSLSRFAKRHPKTLTPMGRVKRG
jgi:hypothetical protein